MSKFCIIWDFYRTGNNNNNNYEMLQKKLQVVHYSNLIKLWSVFRKCTKVHEQLRRTQKFQDERCLLVFLCGIAVVLFSRRHRRTENLGTTCPLRNTRWFFSFTSMITPQTSLRCGKRVRYGRNKYFRAVGKPLVALCVLSLTELKPNAIVQQTHRVRALHERRRT